jgi:hypothetical protein
MGVRREKGGRDRREGRDRGGGDEIEEGGQMRVDVGYRGEDGR